MNESHRAGSLRWPLLGAATAIAVTTTMDATGLSMFSALPLFLLTGLFWFLGKYSRNEMGITLGSPEGYVWAVAYPLVVPGLITVAALASGAVDTTGAEWGKAGKEIALMSSVGILGVLLTEEGFFRGWFWGGLKRAGRGDAAVLVWTSLIFSLWHLSAVVLDTGFAPPSEQIPVFMVNAALLGFNWGMMRWISGSAVAAALSHSVWNALVYTLFGFGEKIGILGISDTGVFGPEVGFLGLAGNGLFALILWTRIRKRSEKQQAQ